MLQPCLLPLWIDARLVSTSPAWYRYLTVKPAGAFAMCIVSSVSCRHTNARQIPGGGTFSTATA
jgi:hypothetical protein